jgi:hypothetical protein
MSVIYRSSISEAFIWYWTYTATAARIANKGKLETGDRVLATEKA